MKSLVLHSPWLAGIPVHNPPVALVVTTKPKMGPSKICLQRFGSIIGSKLWKDGNLKDWSNGVEVGVEIEYRAKEAQIVSTCMKNGVFIGYGSNFFTEELGWFRVTFTARKEALVEGLKRILSSLEEVEAA